MAWEPDHRSNIFLKLHIYVSSHVYCDVRQQILNKFETNPDKISTMEKSN